jgi:hypothetical protein
MATRAVLDLAIDHRIGGLFTVMAVPDAPLQNRDPIPPLFRQIETPFVTRYQETPHADPKLCSTPPVDPEVAVTREISEVEVAAEAGVGGMIVATEGETAILISEIEETPPTGMTVVESVNAPTGATVIETSLEDVDPPPADAHRLEGTSETRETRGTVLSV